MPPEECPPPYSGTGCPPAPSPVAAAVNQCGIGSRIEDWVDPCDDPDDFFPAFDRAVKASGSVTSATGFTLLFGPRKYNFKQTPTLYRGMHLRGQGGHSTSTAGTVFTYENGIDGLHARYADNATTPPLCPPGGLGRSDFSIVENICFQGRGPVNSAGNHGIWALAPIRIKNCFVSDWGGNGIRFTSGSENGVPTSVTNHSVVEHTLVQSSGSDGIYVTGPNSYKILFIAVHAKSNKGWGFYDDSALGTTLVACLTHNNGTMGDPETGVPSTGGSYKVAQATARTLLLSCYSEGSQPPVPAPPKPGDGGPGDGGVRTAPGPAYAELAALTVAIGGGGLFAPSPDSAGQHLKALTNGWTAARKMLKAYNRLTPPVSGRYHFGAVGGSTQGTAFEFGTDDDSRPYRLTYGASDAGWWQLSWAGTAPVLGFATPNAAEYSQRGNAAMAWLKSGVYVGPELQRGDGSLVKVFVTTGTGKPTTGTWKRGDRVMNANPTTSGILGWVCIQDTDATHAQGRWAVLGRV